VYKMNPKTGDSGIICCIPQKGKCKNGCPDCFFNTGRSYLSPLEDNLPNIPSVEQSKGRIVRMNDGNDSNCERDLVEKTAQQYDDYFFNTADPRELDTFSGPVVLTVNPGSMTDHDFCKLLEIPKNLMFVRVRVNTWNVETVVVPSIRHYTGMNTPVILTFMAYYTEPVPKSEMDTYIWKKRTSNSYYCMEQDYVDQIMDYFSDDPLVYKCGFKDTYDCSRCGNCLREYYNTKVRLQNIKKEN
jgi:hypothetical protein